MGSRAVHVFEVLPVGALMASLAAKLVFAGQFDQWQVESASRSATIAVLLLMHAPLMWGGRTLRFAGAIAVNAAVTALLIADQIHFSFFGDLISVSQLSYAWMIPSVADSVGEALSFSHAVLYADIVVASLALPFYARWLGVLPEMRIPRRAAWSGVAAVSGLLFAIPPIGLVQRDPDHDFEWRSSTTRLATIIGVLPYHVFDAGAHVATLWTRGQVSASDRQEVRAFLDARRHRLRERRSPMFGVARGLNVIMVQAESLHSFPIGLTLNGQEVTPNLNAFARESLRFTSFHDQTWLGATSDSLFLSLQSLYPLGPGEGAVSTRYLTNQYRGLPAVLSEHGYSTMAAMGAPGKYWNMGQMMRKMGFERSHLDEAYSDAPRFGQGVADDEFFRRTVPLIAREREPLMAFLVSVSNHHPYNLPGHYRTLNLGSLSGSVFGGYLDSVHLFDRAFGEFLDGLRRTGLLDRSMVVLYGDHEGWLGEPPELAALLGFPAANAFEYWKARKQVPLLIRFPEGRYAGPNPIPAGHVDTAPTILSLLGFESEYVMLGSDLTQGDDPLVVFRDGSFATGDHYFVDAPTLGPRAVCYAVASGDTADCGASASRVRDVEQRLRVSDLIIRGNLVTVGNGDE